jgi:Ulp1 family protease
MEHQGYECIKKHKHKRYFNTNARLIFCIHTTVHGFTATINQNTKTIETMDSMHATTIKNLITNNCPLDIMT